MSLKVYETLEQGTPEWLQARCGILTASVIGQMITPKTKALSHSETAKTMIRTLIAERITGRVEPIHPTRAMERGTYEEPIARGLYAQHYAPVEEIGFMVRTEPEFTVGYSPDGLVGKRGLIEIKSRAQKTQLATILADEVPSYNIAQIQCGLYVSGRDWCDYVSFCGGMPLYVKRVYRDYVWIKAIEKAALSFSEQAHDTITDYEARTEGMIPTEPSNFDNMEDLSW